VRELSSYEFAPLREGARTLHRGSASGLPPILLVTAEDDSVACLKRLEQEYALRGELDAAWAARPIALVRRDIKPENILLDKASGSAHVPRERQTPEAPEVIAGTLAYMAPEHARDRHRACSGAAPRGLEHCREICVPWLP
jgi:serine/threonine protein kinase